MTLPTTIFYTEYLVSLFCGSHTPIIIVVVLVVVVVAVAVVGGGGGKDKFVKGTPHGL